MRKIAVVLSVAFLLIFAPAAFAGSWSGTTYNGTNSGETATGGAADEVYYMLGGPDTVNANGGEDRVYSGEGSDVVYGGPGYDTLWACGQPNCDQPGHDWLYAQGDGATINAGQSPGVKQYIGCGKDANFDTVYYDSTDQFFITVNGVIYFTSVGNSGCDDPHLVG